MDEDAETVAVRILVVYRVEVELGHDRGEKCELWNNEVNFRVSLFEGRVVVVRGDLVGDAIGTRLQDV